MLIDKSYFNYYEKPQPKIDRMIKTEGFHYTKPLDPVEKIKQRKDKNLMEKIDMLRDYLINDCGISDEKFAEYLAYYSFQEMKPCKKWLKRIDKKIKKKIK